MDSLALLSLVFRWLHILAAITAVGGTIFARAVVFPTLDTLPGDQRSSPIGSRQAITTYKCRQAGLGSRNHEPP